MNDGDWQVPAEQVERETVVKKSRFIARVVPVTDRQAVNAAVAQARADYPDARHHCWAYVLGRPGDAAGAGMSDDGEPAGTAGKPILNVLQHGPLGDALVVVIRYFGGIKLGAGGLVRAYGGAAQAALEQTPAARRRVLQRVEVRGGFELEQALRHWADSHAADLLSVDYGEQLTAALGLPAAELAALREFCLARGARCTELE